MIVEILVWAACLLGIEAIVIVGLILLGFLVWLSRKK